jgi:hypothetical protein
MAIRARGFRGVPQVQTWDIAERFRRCASKIAGRAKTHVDHRPIQVPTGRRFPASNSRKRAPSPLRQRGIVCEFKLKPAAQTAPSHRAAAAC